ncbi:MAG: hypothetical protein HYW05_01145 [Candidatus Diapherotrites archaeon]|nr:hypothetical protein [Candidatus Diapherotrites archaeon]
MNEKARVHIANALVLLVVVGLIFGALAARGGSGNDNGNAHDNMADAELIFTDEDLSAKELKGRALTFIEPMIATAAGDDLSKLLEIKANISESLNADYWLSDESVTNEEVFNSEKSAANDIRTLYNRESSLLDNASLLLAISRLIQADDEISKLQMEQTENLLLQINDEATIAAISSYLNDARSSYEQAWHQIEQPSNYPNSIEHFKNSWNSSYNGLLKLDELTVPIVTIDFPATNTYTTEADQAISGTVWDARLHTIPNVKVNVNDAAYEFSLDNGNYNGAIALSEGNNLITAYATDAFNNAGSAGIEMVLDTIAPEITIEGVEDGVFYNADVIPIVSIADLHLAETVITLNGNPFASGTSIAEEGEYTLTAYGKDLAGNESSRTISFVIDKTPPAVVINAPADLVYLRQVVQINGTATDKYLDSISLKINGNEVSSIANFEWNTIEYADGAYNIELSARDKAGNASSTTISVIIDNTLPEITISGIEEGAFYNYDVVPVVEVIEANPDITTAMLDNAEFELGSSISEEGMHEFSATATDKAGNSASRSVSFGIDKTAPITTDNAITGWVNTDVVVILTSVDNLSGVTKTYYSINNGAEQEGTQITLTETGEYIISYYSTDIAGNVEDAKQSAKVQIDKIAPEISVIAPEERDYSYTAILPLNFSATDADSGLKELNAELDGIAVNSGENINLYSYALGQHTLVISAIDNAGNSATKSVVFNLIDDVKPESNAELAGTPGNNNWYVSDATIILTAIDAKSGVKKIQYSTDGSTYADYAAPLIISTEGLTTIYYRAEDNSGNIEDTKTISFKIDKTPPELNITELNENPTLEDANYSILVETENGADLGVSIIQTNIDTSTGSNLGATQSSESIAHNGSAIYRMDVIEGINEIIFTAMDEAGNTTIKQFRRLVDRDKISDSYEIEMLKTDPLKADSDSDGINDDIEDFDADGLTNLAEFLLGSNPFDADSDDDTLTDFYEVVMTNTSPTDSDTKDAGISDGLQDFDEEGLTNASEQQYGTHPFREDTDKDGISDSNEINTYRTDPLNPDTSNDGITDGDAVRYGLNPSENNSNTQLTFEFANEAADAEIEIKARGKIIDDVNIEVNQNPFPLLKNLSGISSEFIAISVDENFDSATIKVHYNPSEIPDPSKLRLFRFDPEQRIPVEAGVQGIDIVNNLVWAETNSFSLWFLADPNDWYANSAISWNRPELVFSSEEIMTVKARIRNNTSVPTSNVRVDFYAGNPDSGGILIGTTYVDVPGNNYAFASIEWLPENIKDVYVVVDPAGLIAETDKTNNKASRVFETYIDSDGDGLSDSEETNGMRLLFPYTPIYTDPNNPDSDADGLSDSEEMGAQIEINGKLYYNPVSLPDKADSDADGLDDYSESEGWYVSVISNLSTLKEVLQKQENDEDYTSFITNYHVTSNPMLYDTDNDYVNDEREMAFGSDPRNKDTDGDWLRDNRDDDPTVIETEVPKIELLGITIIDYKVGPGIPPLPPSITIWAEVAYFTEDNVKIKVVSLENNGNPQTSHYSEGLYLDGFSSELVSGALFGIDVRVRAEDLVGNERIVQIIYAEGVVAGVYKFFDEQVKAFITSPSAYNYGFGHGLIDGVAMEVGDTVDFVGSVVTEGAQPWIAAGKGIETVANEGLGIIFEAYGQRMKPLREADNPYPKNTPDYSSFNTGWNTGFGTGYISTAVVEGIAISKGASWAASVAKNLANSGKLAGIASKLSKAGKIIKSAASMPLKNKLVLGASAVGSTYLLKEAFPDIDALDNLYYLELGVAPTFLTMGEGKNLRKLNALTPDEQEGVLKFIARNDQSAIKTRVNFLNKLDDASLKNWANTEASIQKHLYGGVVKLRKLGYDDELIANVYKNNGDLTQTLRIAKDGSGVTGWLEIGDRAAKNGWDHIKFDHQLDFVKNIGAEFVNGDKLKDLVIESVRNGLTPDYPTQYFFEVKPGKWMRTVRGSNGYIHTSHPVEIDQVPLSIR